MLRFEGEQNLSQLIFFMHFGFQVKGFLKTKNKKNQNWLATWDF